MCSARPPASASTASRFALAFFVYRRFAGGSDAAVAAALEV